MNLGPAEFVRGAVETAEEGGEWTFHRFSPGQAAAYREAGLDDFFGKTFASAGVRILSGYNLVPHLPEFFSDGRLHPNDLGFGIFSQNLQSPVFRLGDGGR